jgi:hypothetical protein
MISSYDSVVLMASLFSGLPVVEFLLLFKHTAKREAQAVRASAVFSDQRCVSSYLLLAKKIQ